MRSDGTCPTCGRDIAEERDRTASATEDERTPWHFKLLVIALIAYLTWRMVDLFV